MKHLWKLRKIQFAKILQKRRYFHQRRADLVRLVTERERGREIRKEKKEM